jgi:hypothetical protein
MRPIALFSLKGGWSTIEEPHDSER